MVDKCYKHQKKIIFVMRFFTNLTFCEMRTTRLPLLGTFALASTLASCANAASDDKQPNIIIIYADDLGFGDVSANGATEISTPNIDRIAKSGVRFTNFHSTAATSTPSRFSLLTGTYAWRVPNTAIAPGNGELVIPSETKCIPAMLKEANYNTGIVGKWHLGLGTERGKQDWNGIIAPGPEAIGFDYSFIIPATADRTPCVFIENQRVVNLDPNDPIEISYAKPFEGVPTGKDNPELLKLHPSHGHNNTIINGISRIGHMKGGKSAEWIDEEIADRITEKAVSFITESSKSDKPFFLYFATTDVHVPRAPHPRFVGTTTMGARGDAIMEFDWSVGEILDIIEELGIADNTLVILSSDNGPVVDDGYQDRAVELLGDHTPSGEFRGGKSSAFEAGTRVPTFAQWGKRIKANSSSNAAISHVDIFASLASLVGINLEEEDAPDSQDMMKAILGKDKNGREYIIGHSQTHSITKGDWKYIKENPKLKGPVYVKVTNTEMGTDKIPQLYNLKDDIGEQNNLAEHYPEKVKELSELLEKEINR